MCAARLAQDLADSSEEEEEGGNDYDLDDQFLVGDDQESDEGGEGAEGEEEGRRRRRRKRRREEVQLDEEDYELIVRAPSTTMGPFFIFTMCALSHGMGIAAPDEQHRL